MRFLEDRDKTKKHTINECFELIINNKKKETNNNVTTIIMIMIIIKIISIMITIIISKIYNQQTINYLYLIIY